MANAEPSLADWQQAFVQSLFTQDDTGIAASIRPQGQLTASQRIGIYRNSSQAIHREHLAAVYPVCQQLLGEAFFVHLSRYYVHHFPPTTLFLSDYGEQLSPLIQQHDQLSKHRWIADIARLEWARHYAWHSPGVAMSDWSVLATLTTEQQAALRFRLLPSATVIRSPWAIHQVWLAHQPEATVSFADITLDQAETVLVIRLGRRISQQVLSESMSTFLDAITAGKTLRELTALVGDSVGELLRHCIASGWLVLR